jgi:hypothetical protein
MKLYVLIRNDMPLPNQAAQACHAVEEYQIHVPGRRSDETVVLLQTDNIERWMRKLDMRDIQYYSFREPDLGGMVTALATYQDGRLFKSLKLMGV